MLSSSTGFDPSALRRCLDTFWGLPSAFGLERSAFYTYLSEIVSDRFALTKGFVILRDELQLAGLSDDPNLAACGVDLTMPCVVTTVAHTNCGDRITVGEATKRYKEVVVARFATMSEVGGYKAEAFQPTGGGTDDGKTLAGVTIEHQLDPQLRKRIYDGNPRSFVLAGADLKTHVGRMDRDDGLSEFGRTAESPWRQPRAACGAMVGTLTAFSDQNPVHRRLRRDLGEDNFKWLVDRKAKGDDDTDLTFVVGAAIVAIQGMLSTAKAFAEKMDERSCAHLTASITVNRTSRDDTVLYLARATVFGGEIKVQGLGLDATKYTGRMITHSGETRLELEYDGVKGEDFQPLVVSAK